VEGGLWHLRRRGERGQEEAKNESQFQRKQTRRALTNNSVSRQISRKSRKQSRF
jgi:hypothetical protein